jgi:myosin-5
MDIDILNNPELLYHIKRNFLNKNIYTYVGPTLLITNPYKYYSELYTK